MTANDPAFPEFRHPTKVTDHPIPYWTAGLTKREWLAGMAMQGLISHIEEREDYTAKLPAGVIARMAVSQADALLAELEKTNKENKQ